METTNLTTLAKVAFSNESAAVELMTRLRWPNGVACPRCGGADPYKITPKAQPGRPARRGLFKCSACKKQFSVTTGSVFEASHVPLSKWLMAIHLMSASKKGMSAHQLHRMLGTTYRAAWFMMHRLRLAMDSNMGVFARLTGVVEVDETYIGAKNKRGTKRGRPGLGSHKTPVLALVQRGGRVRAFPMERVTSANLNAAIKTHMDPNATMMTDDFAAYKSTDHADHQTVNHSSGEYVRGSAHTNTAEGFFSLLKRGINGSFHHVSKGHLHRYVTEFEFRYSNRLALGVNDSQRTEKIILGAEGKRLTYKKRSSHRAA